MLRAIFLLIFSMNLFSIPLNNPQDWRGITDQVMGGASELNIRYLDGIFSMRGYVSMANNGGFVRLSTKIDIASNNFKGIRFKAKGNNETYEIHVTLKGLRIPPWSYLSQEFDVNNEWQEHTIFFKDLERRSGLSAASMKAKNIKDISFAGFGRNFNVDLLIKDINLITE